MAALHRADAAAIRVLDVHNQELDTLDGLAKFSSLESLNAASNSLKPISDAGTIASLTSLVISANDIRGNFPASW